MADTGFFNFDNAPLALDGVALSDIAVHAANTGKLRLCTGMAINLYCRGHRDQFGAVYKSMLEDIQQRTGAYFESRNDNGKRRKITPKAILKEHAEFDAPAAGARRRSPLVYISRWSNREGDEIPPILHLGYADRDEELSLTLTVPLNADCLGQATMVLGTVRSWLPGLPLWCGTISPAMVYPASHHLVRDEVGQLQVRWPMLLPEHDGSAFLDGLVNWGVVTLLGPELTARLGGHGAMQAAAPDGFVVQACEGNTVIVAERDVFAATNAAAQHTIEASHRQLGAWLAPIKSSTWMMKPDSEAKWFRLGGMRHAAPAGTFNADTAAT